MIISSRGRYAIGMMCDLAVHPGECCSLTDIARRQCISRKYLEQIVPCLSRAGFVIAARGTQGGYRLAKAPEEYDLAEILKVTEGSLCPVGCMEEGGEPCPHYGTCATVPVWEGLSRVINDYLSGITLKNVAELEKARSEKAPEE